MTQLDEKALEAADAEAALAAAARLTSNIRDVEDSYVADVDASNARERQRGARDARGRGPRKK